MTQKNTMVGIDIGTSKLRLVAGRRRSHGGIELLAAFEFPSEGVVRANITNIEKTSNTLKRIVEDASAALGEPIQEVVLSLSGAHIKSQLQRSNLTRESEEEEITRKDVEKLNKDMYRMAIQPGMEIIDVVPQSYMVDYEENIKDPVGMSGMRLQGLFHVVTAQTNLINNLYKCAERAGLTIKDVVLGAFSAGYAVLTEEEKEAGVCLVDIGASTLYITIFSKEGLQYMASVPFGGQSITRDLAQAFMMMESQAEQLKIKFGAAFEEGNDNTYIAIPGMRNKTKEIPLPVIHRIIESRQEEAIQLVHSHLLAAGFRNKLPAGIVLTGGGALMRRLEDMFSYMTGYDTRVGLASERIRTEALGEHDLPADYATAVGLLLLQSKSLGSLEKYHERFCLRKTLKKDEEMKKKNQKVKLSLWQRLKKLF